MQIDTEAAPSVSSFYKPLPRSSHHIRLIILHPPSSDPAHESEIKCSLRQESLEHYPEFEALSYAWGEAGTEKDIIADGVTIPVRENLWDALFHLREKNDRYLWIDAICIDQANTGERNHQVQQMSRIYKQALRVLIWLGRESEDSKEALDFINPDSAASVKERNLGIDYSQFMRKVEALCRLCDRPYWRRLWIVQEVVLARDARIQCGRDYVSWQHFSEFRAKWDETIGIAHARRYFADARKRFAFDLDRFRVREGVDLKDLLQSFQTSLCSDVRDKVYGLAGLARDGQELPIDYSKSVFEIFADVLLLQRGAESATLVSFARFLQRVLEINPWDNIPESKSLSREMVRTVGQGRGVILLLGPLLTHFEPSRQELDVEGSFGGRFFWNLWNVGNFLSVKATCRIRREVIAIHSPVSYGIGDRQSRGRSSALSTIREARSTTTSLSVPRVYVPNAPQTGQASQRLQAKQRIDEETAQGYGEAAPRLFLDIEYNVGLVPSNARAGDTICGFDDSNIVAVLRRIEGRYMFVGRVTFVRLTNNEVHFVVPRINRGESIDLYMNAHTVYLLTK
jgi:hypothetical protein